MNIKVKNETRFLNAQKKLKDTLDLFEKGGIVVPSFKGNTSESGTYDEMILEEWTSGLKKEGLQVTVATEPNAIEIESI